MRHRNYIVHIRHRRHRRHIRPLRYGRKIIHKRIRHKHGRHMRHRNNIIPTRHRSYIIHIRHKKYRRYRRHIRPLRCGRKIIHKQIRHSMEDTWDIEVI